MYRTIWIVLFTIITLSTSHAEIYKWVDENGKAHYSDSNVSASPNTDIKTVELKPINSIEKNAAEDAYTAEVIKRQDQELKADKENKSTQSKDKNKPDTEQNTKKENPPEEKPDSVVVKVSGKSCHSRDCPTCPEYRITCDKHRRKIPD